MGREQEIGAKEETSDLLQEADEDLGRNAQSGFGRWNRQGSLRGASFQEHGNARRYR